MGKLYEDIVSRDATYREDNEKILSAYDKMLMNELAEKIFEAYNETTPGDDFIGPKQKRTFPTKHTRVGGGNMNIKKSGKKIAAKMKKNDLMKGFANKVAKMKTITELELEKMLPDYIPGWEVANLFKESTQLSEEKFAGWIAMYGGKKLEIKKGDAKDLYGAKQNALKHFKVPKSKQGLLAIEPAYESTQLSEGKWLDVAKQVVKKKQFVYINPKTGKTSDDKKKGFIILDMTTANMLVQIADALKKETSEKFTSMPLIQAVDIGWKLVSK